MSICPFFFRQATSGVTADWLAQASSIFQRLHSLVHLPRVVARVLLFPVDPSPIATLSLQKAGGSHSPDRLFGSFGEVGAPSQPGSMQVSAEDICTRTCIGLGVSIRPAVF